MPNWGLHGMNYRDIDAVAHYIDGVPRAGSGNEARVGIAARAAPPPPLAP